GAPFHASPPWPGGGLPADPGCAPGGLLLARRRARDLFPAVPLPSVSRHGAPRPRDLPPRAAGAASPARCPGRLLLRIHHDQPAASGAGGTLAALPRTGRDRGPGERGGRGAADA